MNQEDINRLAEIKDEMKELMYEAHQILRHSSEHVQARAKSYWWAHITMALDNDHTYLGGSMCTMQETIDSLAAETELTEE